jgi:hypothetical protein
MYIGNVMLLMLNLPLIGMWVQLLKLPYNVLFPLILLFTIIGVYCSGNNVFDIYVMIGFGMIGYLMRKFGYEPAPLVLAFVLGPMLENNLRKALILSQGDLMTFVQRPISAVCLVLAVLIGPLLIGPTAALTRGRFIRTAGRTLGRDAEDHSIALHQSDQERSLQGDAHGISAARDGLRRFHLAAAGQRGAQGGRRLDAREARAGLQKGATEGQKILMKA